MAAVDLSLLGRDLPDLRRYRDALSRSSVALSSEFNLPTDRHQLLSRGSYRADQRQRFQQPFSAAQRDLDGDAAAELGQLNLRPFSSASTREVIAEAQRIVDKYRQRTLAGRWPTDSDTRRGFESARRVAPMPPAAPPPAPASLRKAFNNLNDLNAVGEDHDAGGGGLLVGDGGYRQPALRSPAALFSDPRRRSLATPLPSQQQRWRSRTEVEARRQAMRILRDVGLSDAYRSQAEVEEAQQQQQLQQQLQQQHQQQHQLNHQQYQHLPHHQQQRQQHPPPPPPQSPGLDEFASGARPLRTPLASSGYASYEEFQAKTAPMWRHPLPSQVGAGFCDEDTRRKVWDWLTEPDQLSRHEYLMKLCD